MIQPYQAVVLQGTIREIREGDTREQILRSNAWRQTILLRRLKFSYPRLKLVVTSESATHGLDAGRPRSSIAPLAVDIDSPEFMPYRLAAKEFEIYLAFTMQEKDKHFPDTFFHTGVIIDPRGEVILRQRMLNASLAQSGGTGYATRLRQLYGEDALFPVVETPLGVMGLIVGGDILQPELGRTLALRGAEILVHPTGSRETEASRMMGAIRRATAYFNQAYLLCANIGTYEHKAYGDPPPADDAAFAERLKTTSTWGQFEFCGRSIVVDYRGRVLAMCQQAGEAATGAVLDVERLRYERRVRPLLSRIGPAIAGEYRAFPGVPNDTEELPDPREARRMVAGSLRERGIVQRSEAYGG